MTIVFAVDNVTLFIIPSLLYRPSVYLVNAGELIATVPLAVNVKLDPAHKTSIKPKAPASTPATFPAPHPKRYLESPAVQGFIGIAPTIVSDKILPPAEAAA
jgi:hypothetical protein